MIVAKEVAIEIVMMVVAVVVVVVEEAIVYKMSIGQVSDGLKKRAKMRIMQ
jgi:hypothetical protein